MDDPRIYPVGRFLRKISSTRFRNSGIVLCGDMSLVGPRPPLAYDSGSTNIWHRGRARA